MKDENKLYIVPPKLQKKMLIGGLNVPETLLSMGVGILLVIVSALNLLWIVGLFILLSWRFSNDRNAFYYFGILIKYYRTTQIYTRRLGDEKIANTKPDRLSNSR